MEPEVTLLALSARQAARALGISERSLWAATQPRGPIPCVKLGARVLYPVAGVNQWLSDAAQMKSSEEEAESESPSEH